MLLDLIKSLDEAQIFRVYRQIVEFKLTHPIYFLIAQNQQEMKRIWGLKVFICNPFFPSIFLFIHSHFVLVFFLLLSYLQRSKKYCKLRLDEAIAMKTIKKGQEMRNILICGQYNMHGIKCFLKTWMWIPISKISQNVMLGITIYFFKGGASSFLGGLCKHIYGALQIH